MQGEAEKRWTRHVFVEWEKMKFPRLRRPFKFGLGEQRYRSSKAKPRKAGLDSCVKQNQ